MSLNKSQSNLATSIKVIGIPLSIDKDLILDHFKSKGNITDTHVGDDYILITFADQTQKTNSLSSQDFPLTKEYTIIIDPLTSTHDIQDDFEVIDEAENLLIRSMDREDRTQKVEEPDISEHYEVLHAGTENKGQKLAESVVEEIGPTELETSKYEIITGKTNKATEDPSKEIFTTKYFVNFTIIWASVLFVRSFF